MIKQCIICKKNFLACGGNQFKIRPPNARSHHAKTCGDPKCTRDLKTQWRKKNPDKVAAIYKRWATQTKNVDHINRVRRARRARNVEKFRLMARMRYHGSHAYREKIRKIGQKERALIKFAKRILVESEVTL